MEKSELKQLIFDSIVAKVGDSEADRLSEMAATLRNELSNREVRFKFLKKDGTIRDAVATTCPDLLPPAPETNDPTPKKERVPNYSIINFYDLQKGAWRSCKVENLLEADF